MSVKSDIARLGSMMKQMAMQAAESVLLADLFPVFGHESDNLSVARFALCDDRLSFLGTER